MRIQAPLDWARRVLHACEIGGDPFRVAFDDHAQADVTPSQAAHLQTHSGLTLTPVPDSPPDDAPRREDPPAPADPPASPDVPTAPSPAASPAKPPASAKKRRR